MRVVHEDHFRTVGGALLVLDHVGAALEGHNDGDDGPRSPVRRTRRQSIHTLSGFEKWAAISLS